jgi:hypothetical protein
MSIADAISLTDEVKQDNILDDIRLYRVNESDSIEADADRVLNKLTYPTETFVNLLQSIDPTTSVSGTTGAHVIAGRRGSGKSHMLLALYHMISNPELGRQWMTDHDIDPMPELPKAPESVALQYLNLPDPNELNRYDQIWEPIYDQLGMQEELDSFGDRAPRVQDIRKLAEDNEVVLFLDELESHITPKDPDTKQRDVNFFHNLVEAATEDESDLTVFVTLLREDRDIQQELTRVTYEAHDLDLEETRDEKINFILHRLVKDPLQDQIQAIVDDYINSYRNTGVLEIENYEALREDMERYYPFHPWMLNTILDKYTQGTAASDARGFMRQLAKILRQKVNEVDLILTSDALVAEELPYYKSIDRELCEEYDKDRERLQTEDGSYPEYVRGIIDTILIYSLTRTGEYGCNKTQLIVGIIRPGGGANEVLHKLQTTVRERALRLEVNGGNNVYRFRAGLTGRGLVDSRAEHFDSGESFDRIKDFITEEVFTDNRCYVWDSNAENPDEDIPRDRSLKLLFNLKARQDEDDYADDFAAWFDGQNQNSALFVVPKRISVDSEGTISLGKKLLAAEQLEDDRSPDQLPEDFDEATQDVIDDLRTTIRDKYAKVGTIVGSGDFHFTPCDATVDDIVDTGTDSVLDIQQDAEQIIRDAGPDGISVNVLKNRFYSDPQLSTMESGGDLELALKTLCDQEDIAIQRGASTSFGERPATVSDNHHLIHEDYYEPPEEGTPELQAGTTEGGEEGTTTTGATTSTGTGTTTTQTGQETDEDESETVEDDGPEHDYIPGPIRGQKLEEDSQPGLVHTLDQKLGNNDFIVEAELEIYGSLNESEREDQFQGLSGHSEITEDRTYDFEFDSNGVAAAAFLRSLQNINVPSDAELKIWLKILKED